MLYLLDKFGVGGAFYHELSMINRSLPRLHKVKQAIVEYNSDIQLKMIPHYDGVSLFRIHSRSKLTSWYDTSVEYDSTMIMNNAIDGE